MAEGGLLRRSAITQMNQYLSLSGKGEYLLPKMVAGDLNIT
jgi:hypothetical protein